MDGTTFESLAELRNAAVRAEWDGRFLYAALIRRLYLISYCNANGLPVDTGDY